MNRKLNFEVIKTKWKARLWKITLNWKTITTPVFMPVWTKATIKWLILDMLNDPKYTWTEKKIWIILANTFHLYLSPWSENIKDFWWLHKFENWDWLILTDSWWFQVFSLWLDKRSKRNQSLVKIKEEWVWFKSPKDWSKHFFSPENVVDTQCNFWSDIMMVLDVCSPVHWNNKKKVANQMELTHRWAKRAFDHFEDKYDKSRWVLFPIAQWWLYEDLRIQSVEYLKNYAWDWIAIWWVSVWESKEEMYKVVEWVNEYLPEDKPRYLMWVWTPEDLIETIYQWIDMYDCVLPTRLARHWVAFTSEWKVRIKNSENKLSKEPLDKNCNCFACKNFTKWYLNHLFREKEMLWATLMSLHNIVYLHNLVEDIKNDILNS